MINNPAVLRLLTAQHWVASHEQLRQLAVTPSTIYRARRAGIVRTVVPGVVQVTGTPDSFVARAMALPLHAGKDVFISGASAGVLHGLRQMPRRIVECTIGETRKVVLPAWARLHVTTWIDPPRDVMVQPDGLRVATPLRMLFRLAWVFNQHRFERAAEDAWHLGLVTPAETEDYLAAVRRSGGRASSSSSTGCSAHRCASVRVRAVSSRTSSTPSAAPAFRNPNGSFR